MTPDDLIILVLSFTIIILLVIIHVLIQKKDFYKSFSEHLHNTLTKTQFDYENILSKYFQLKKSNKNLTEHLKKLT
jgi:hypothetical protein